MKPCPFSVACMSSRKMGCQSPSPFPAAVSSVSRLSIVKVDQPSWSMSLHVYMTLIQNPRRFFGKFHQVTGPATSTPPGKKQGTAKFDYVYRSTSGTMKLCADFMVFDQGAVLSRDLWTREPTASSSRVKSSHLVGARSPCVPGCTSVRGGFFGAVPNSSIE